MSVILLNNYLPNVVIRTINIPRRPPILVKTRYIYVDLIRIHLKGHKAKQAGNVDNGQF